MANTYKGILTNNGKALIANATVNNKINYSHIAVGDGNGSVPTPSETRPTLINEKARIALNVVELNPNNTNQIVCEAIIPTNIGGFYIRELALYAGNTMVVNASYPPTYKPLADEGGAREIAIKIVLNIQNAEVIALYLDDSLIYATREWVNANYIRRNEIVDNLTTDTSNKPLSGRQGKILQDNKLDKTGNAVSASKLQNSRKIFGQSFDGSADVSGNVTTSTGILLADVNHFIDVGRAGLDRMNFNVYSGVFNFIDTQTGNIVARLNSNGIDCNSATSTKLKDVRKINTVAFDGTKDIDVSAPMRELTATHPDKALDDGFYICGGVNIAGLYPYGILETRRGANGTINQTYYAHMGDFRVAVRQAWDGGQDFSEWMVVGLRANTASRLENPRTVSFSGAATGAFNYDGSANSTCVLTLSNSGVVAGTYASTVHIPSITVNDKGLITGISQQTIRSASVMQTGIVQLVDHLASEDATKALTAKQGRILQDNKLDKTVNAVGIETKENRTLKPNQLQPRSVQSIFGTLNSDNTGQYADFLTLNGWHDSSGGFKNALVFSKTSQELFHFQGLYDSQTWSTKRKISYTDNQTFTGSNKFTGDIQVDGPIYAQKYRGDSDFWFTSKDENTAKRLLTGGLLASNNYSDASKIPELGIYSKGHIYTPSDVCSDTYRGYASTAKFTGHLDGKLLNARMINGVAFDASYDINIPPVSFYITAGADLNNYQSTGFFFQDADAAAQQISNVPVQSAFALRVERSAGCSQWFTPYNGSGVTYFRHYYSGSWSNWIVLKPNLVTLSGQLSGSASFDDSGNINISASVIQGLGVNQRWQNVTTYRANNTIYTNSRPYPISIAVGASGRDASVEIYVSGVLVVGTSNIFDSDACVATGTAIVPPGEQYQASARNKYGNGLRFWSELF